MNERIRQKIKDKQRELGMTNAAIAKELDISPQAVGQIINGERGAIPRSLLDVLKILGLDLEAIER